MILDIYFLICLYREIDGEIFLRPRTRNGIRNAMVVSFWSLLPSENNKRCNLLKHRRLERNEHFDTFRVWATNVFHSLMVIMVEGIKWLIIVFTITISYIFWWA